ncbi:hypothetical protein [Tautonia sociabilis]|uniref:Uncharacterized protein n=1 Tax=Tautonia sociabilis TaxID=2080755 RepID=A0A432MJD1_9BACT|nr:hypothetical protein [Tautonia sociabilis]RUL87317.1 hypothetical protein TsocGM_13150 [Tautonia sociabilis]
MTPTFQGTATTEALSVLGSPDGFPLLPPRPNPGPEPWHGPGVDGWWAVPISAAIVLVGLGIALRARRRRRSHPARVSSAIPATRPSSSSSPADRLVARAEAIREAIITAFGPSWAARTTEELASSPELADRIGADRSCRVIALLAEADRVKFSGEVPSEDQGDPEDLDRWVAEILAALSAAGATSTSIGR